MWSLSVPVWELVARSILIYAALLVALRVFGKRQVGQFTLYDLVLVLLVANAVQPAMTGPDSSLAGGLVIIGTLVLVNFAVAWLDRNTLFHHLFTPEPAVVIREGRYVSDRLWREGVTEDECETAIREHGLNGVADVKLGVLEPDGSISIVGKDADVTRTQRHIRHRRRIVGHRRPAS